MNHVSTFLGILVLLLSAMGSRSSSLLTKSLEANSRQQTPTRTIIRKHRVSIGPLRQEAYLDKSIEVSWKYLNELEEYKSIFSKQEIDAVDDLNRLGIRIIVKKHFDGVLRIKYLKTISVGAEAPRTGDESFDELYICKNVIGKETVDENVENIWNVLDNKCPVYSSNFLEIFIKNNLLLSAALLLKLQPDVFEHVSLEIYSEYIFTINNTQNVLKYFIFQDNPTGFMDKYLQVYKKDPAAVHRLIALSRVLTDLRISDEKVEAAFNSIVKGEYFDCLVPILATFVNSKRPLKIDADDLRRIVLMDGKENVKERVVLLKLSKDPVFLDKLVLKCFSSNLYSPLVREILFDKELANVLSTEFTKTLFINMIYQDRYNALKFILSSEIMKKMKEKTKKFGLFLAKSVDHVSLETFKVLVGSRMRKTNVPFFSSQDIIRTAYLLIKKKIKPELLQYLIEERLIAPNQKAAFDGSSVGDGVGEGLSLLAVAVKERNYNFIGLLNKINWRRCEDVYGIESINEEMKSLLVSKGAQFPEDDPIHDSPPDTTPDSSHDSSPFMSPYSPKSPSSCLLMTTPLKRSSESALDLVTNETTFETPELKKQKHAQYSDIPEVFYQNAFETRDEESMCRILSNNEEFKRSYGYIQIIQDLYYVQMLKSLNQVLDHLPADLLSKIVKEFAELECEYVIDYLIKKGHFNLENVCFEGMNLISYLLKKRRANFALQLIERFKFDLSLTQDPENNPEGDIILCAVWNMDLVESLLEMGASPNVKIRYTKLDKVISLKEYAILTNRTKLLHILEKYHAE